MEKTWCGFVLRICLFLLQADERRGHKREPERRIRTVSEWLKVKKEKLLKEKKKQDSNNGEGVSFSFCTGNLQITATKTEEADKEGDLKAPFFFLTGFENVSIL